MDDLMNDLALEDVASFLQWILDCNRGDGKQCDYVIENPIILLSYADCYIKEKQKKETAGELVQHLYQYCNQFKGQIVNIRERKMSEQKWGQLQTEIYEAKEEIKASSLAEEKKEFVIQVLEKLRTWKKGDEVSLPLLWECQNEFHGFLIGMGKASALILEILMPYPQVQYYLGI